MRDFIWTSAIFPDVCVLDHCPPGFGNGHYKCTKPFPQRPAYRCDSGWNVWVDPVVGAQCLKHGPVNQGWVATKTKIWEGSYCNEGHV